MYYRIEIDAEKVAHIVCERDKYVIDIVSLSDANIGTISKVYERTLCLNDLRLNRHKEDWFRFTDELCVFQVIGKLNDKFYIRMSTGTIREVDGNKKMYAVDKVTKDLVF